MKNLLLSFLLIAVPVALTGCDSEDDPSEATYSGEFMELNDSGVEGDARITIDEEANTFTVSIDATGLDDVLHAQHIHGEGVCPDENADANDDSYVDVVEGLPSYGGILLPLDGDIGSQEQIVDTYPTGTEIDYQESTSFSGLESELAVEDMNEDDPIVTLGVDGELQPGTNTIVIHGTSENLPETVASIADLPNTVTLPVACAEINVD